MSQTSLPFKVVIPARYGSSRLPGKPLKIIAGKPMIQWVYENAQSAGADDVVVATDDQRIVSAVERFNGTAMMTAETHRSGTDRITEVATRKSWHADTIVVNLQGDEPGIQADLLRTVAGALHQHTEAQIATMATPITHAEDLFNPNVVKVVCDDNQLALYFSRAPIPWMRDEFKSDIVQNTRLPKDTTFLRHLGLYAYRVGALKQMSSAPPSDIELAESLEQLRAMSMGFRIHVSTIQQAPGHGVDTEADLKRVSESMVNNDNV
ncbi:MAG: 3-deoxy-manno-octulosonate cytidylyltransferase [Deltaproteobacteria bacterium]|nr:3-deoxy-manno-octulosonate cytidylyltransferase [Deltaproteobacteria bacterium]MBN2672042.1 3-deoxy-manno-octulosonate cytidylyltransferase [Deltaproteobacteria bacterium]